MGKLILFVNSFLSYLLVFALIASLVAVACILGVKWRKRSDARAALEAKENFPDEVDVTGQQ